MFSSVTSGLPFCSIVLFYRKNKCSSRSLRHNYTMSQHLQCF